MGVYILRLKGNYFSGEIMRISTILHLSDLHFDPKNEISQTDNKNPKFPHYANYGSKSNFLTYLNQLSEKHPIKKIIFTGDLAVQGNDYHLMKLGCEYLEKIAKSLGLTNQDLLMIMGNHDCSRDAKNISELGPEFIELCEEYKFMYSPNLEQPLTLTHENIDYIGINSCLGAHIKDESSMNAMEILIERTKKNIFVNIDIQNRDEDSYDIPIIGSEQLNELKRELNKCENELIIIALHHNPLPSQSIEFRPYSQLIDRGGLLHELLHLDKKNILLLHGHTHSENHYELESTTIKSNPIDLKTRLSCISNPGMKNLETSGVVIGYYFRNYFDNNNSYLKTEIYCIRQTQMGFSEDYYDTIINTTRRQSIDLNWTPIKINRPYSIKEISDKLNEPENVILTEVLLKENIHFYIIKKREDDYQEWKIIKMH